MTPLRRLRARPEWQLVAALPRADRPLAAAWWAAVVLRGLLPAELRARVNDLSAEQLIAPRFASDGAVADLAGSVLRDNVDKRAAIKRMIRQWRADEQRV